MSVRLFAVVCLLALRVPAEISKESALLWLDFQEGFGPLKAQNGLRVADGASGKVLEFNAPVQVAEMEFQRKLGDDRELTVGGWFYIKRSGEQYLFSRGIPFVAAGGERMFPR